MYNAETHNRFIELRAQGWSLAHIAAELDVAKCTLIDWQQKFHREIADLKSLELEALQEKVLTTHEQELSRLAGHLNRVESILAKRNFEYVSTEFLFSMAGALRSQIRKQKVVIDFSPAPSGAQSGTPDPTAKHPAPNPQPSTSPQTPDPRSQIPDPKPGTPDPSSQTLDPESK